MINDQYLATAGQTVKNHLRRRHWFGLLALMTSILLVTPNAAAAQSVVEIVEAIEQTGSYVEPGSDASLDAALSDAEQAGVAFVWLNDSGGAPEATALAEDIWNALDARNSQYRIVLVLLDNGYNAYGPVQLSAETMNDALDNALAGFGSGAEGNGLSAFVQTLNQATSSAGSTTPTTTGGGSSGSSGGGFSLGSLLLPLVLIGGLFWMFRNWSRKRKEDKSAAADLEADRLEIKEQLRDNADRVIDLGDRVVLSENRELIDTYEKASRSYQEVSQSVDTATTAEQVDELDDQIDQAEWELEMIEAKLDGRPVPPSPAEVEAEEARQAEEEARAAAQRKAADNSRPALGRDESVVRQAPRNTRSYPRNPVPTGYGRRRGGGLGGGLGGVLGSIILGQMGGRQRSRRTQRRTSSLPGGFGGSGGLGGGVLRPGGSSGRQRSGGRSGSGRSTGSGGRAGGGRSV